MWRTLIWLMEWQRWDHLMMVVLVFSRWLAIIGSDRTVEIELGQILQCDSHWIQFFSHGDCLSSITGINNLEVQSKESIFFVLTILDDDSSSIRKANGEVRNSSYASSKAKLTIDSYVNHPFSSFYLSMLIICLRVVLWKGRKTPFCTHGGGGCSPSDERHADSQSGIHILSRFLSRFSFVRPFFLCRRLMYRRDLMDFDRSLRRTNERFGTTIDACSIVIDWNIDADLE